jgi:hypothetical protein
MEKKSLVILPASDPDGYASGHVNRVYDYIIVPACRLAGLWPERADSPNTTTTASDALKNIIDYDMVICDLSGNNAIAPYGLAIRQTLELPVTLIKDIKTQLTFYMPELTVVEYDDSLRIDTVQKEVETLGEALKKTLAGKPVMNPLLSRLNLGPGQKVELPPIPDTTIVADEPTSHKDETLAPKEKALPIISPLPSYVGDPITENEIEKLKVGDFLFHMNHGKGEIKAVKKMGKDKIAELLFESGSKTLVVGTSGFFRKVNR